MAHETTTALDQLRLELLRAPEEVRAAPAAADRQKYSRIFELCTAIELGLTPWASLPPAAFEAAEARTGVEFVRYKTNGAVADYGIDAASTTMDRVAQAKWYGKTSSVTWEHIGTFSASAESCGASTRTLIVSQDAKIPRRVNGLMRGLPIQRVVLDDTRLNAICAQALAELPTEPADDDPTAQPLTSEEIDTIFREILGDSDEVLTPTLPVEENLGLKELFELAETPAMPAPLHRWQTNGIPLLLESLAGVEDPSETVHACIACGAGKSRLVLELIARGRHTPCAVLVPSRSLLEQFRAEASKWTPHLSVGLVGDSMFELGCDITVATYNSAAKLSDQHFDLLVIDEAHHMEDEFSPSAVDDDKEPRHRAFASAAQSLDFQRALLVSATLDRDEADCAFAYLIDEAVADEVVVDYHIVIPVFAPGNRLEALRQMIVDHPEWTRVLAYCNTVEAAAEFARVCNQGGVLASTFDATTPTRVRRAILKDLAAGRIRVLATVNTLGEGVDVREADTCLFVEPRNSRVNAMQCIGRVQRRCHETGKTVATVVLPAADENRELARFLRVLGANDPRLISTSGLGIGVGRLSIVSNATAEAEREAAEKLSESVYDRAGFFLRGEDADWWEHLELLRAYVAENDRLPTGATTFHDVAIGRWAAAQRAAHKVPQRLSPGQIDALESIPGWRWVIAKDPNAAWNDHIVALIAYRDEFGEIPKNQVWYRDMALGAWVISVQNSKRGSSRSYKLTPERIASLEAIPGWTWGGAARAQTGKKNDWQSNFELLRAYVAENHGIPPAKAVYRDVKLGAWVSYQRAAKKGQGGRKITPERIAALETIEGWQWAERDDLDAAWWTNFELCCDYVAENHKMPSTTAVYRDVKLGTWVMTQRQAKKGQGTYKMTPDRIAALETIEGWQWEDDPDAVWWTNFELCCAYVAENHRMPTWKVVYRDVKLGKWVSNQRMANKGQGTSKMTPERIAALETIEGWRW
jgi:superfamily II DNA/RNA helicase